MRCAGPRGKRRMACKVSGHRLSDVYTYYPQNKPSLVLLHCAVRRIILYVNQISTPIYWVWRPKNDQIMVPGRPR